MAAVSNGTFHISIFEGFHEVVRDEYLCLTEGPGSGDLGDSVGDPDGGGCDPGERSVEEM